MNQYSVIYSTIVTIANIKITTRKLTMNYIFDNCNAKIYGANILIGQSKFGDNDGTFRISTHFDDSIEGYYCNNASIDYHIEIKQSQTGKVTFMNLTDQIRITNYNFANYYNQGAFCALVAIYGVSWQFSNDNNVYSLFNIQFYNSNTVTTILTIYIVGITSKNYENIIKSVNRFAIITTPQTINNPITSKLIPDDNVIHEDTLFIFDNCEIIHRNSSNYLIKFIILEIVNNTSCKCQISFNPVKTMANGYVNITCNDMNDILHNNNSQIIFQPNMTTISLFPQSSIYQTHQQIFDITKQINCYFNETLLLTSILAVIYYFNSRLLSILLIYNFFFLLT